MNAADRWVPDPPETSERAASVAWIDALSATSTIERSPQRLLCHMIEELASTHGALPALLSDIESFTYAQFVDRMRAYAAWASCNGLGRDDRVALIMSNRPEFVAAWMGLSKVGVVTALINTNLSGQSLAHCLELASPSHVVLESNYLEQYHACRPSWRMQALPPVIWCHGDPGGCCNRIDKELLAADIEPDTPRSAVTIDDVALLIYTSGTTGLPKAARVSHRRLLNWALWFKGFLGNTETDRMYNCLPLYHSVGGVVAVAATLVAGGSTVIAGKFSTGRFWDDIRRWDCTQFQYIGELCRYLLNTPAKPGDRQHRLRAICGNGLRADIWMAFKERFAIPQIFEFYAATEGNFSLYNAEGKPGAIGRIPAYLRHRFPVAIIKQDANSNTPMRNDDGFFIAAGRGETGEAIGRVDDTSARFDGYTDRASSEAKILRNVFAKGDSWFRTGDLMRCDAAGYYYFVDRIGDTFRWKGENVSTLEVANVLSQVRGINDVVVYGVPVPGTDGKAGMALLETDTSFDLEQFLDAASAQLPAYALPLFLRIGKQAAVTETFKHKKQDLVRDGFNPDSTSDCLYALLYEERRYCPIDVKLYMEIMSGNLRW